MSNSPLIDLLKEVISTELHLLPINNNIDIEEKQLQATCRFVQIRLKQSMPYFGFSIDIPKGTGNVDPVYPFLQKKKDYVEKMMQFYFSKNLIKYMFYLLNLSRLIKVNT
jgi:hypothetical protein